MPRTHGANLVHHSQVVGWCESDRPLVEVPAAEPSPTEHAIAALVAERIPDRATVQVGIGGIANAVLEALSGHRDLGIHTELLHDGVVDLVEAGVVTGVAKEVRRNRLVTTFCLGTRRLYDWLDDNPSVELLGVDFVNDPRVVARLTRFASVNATTEVDLLGQCASETIGGRYWSGSGGQADFARGAMYAEEGQAFVVTPSETRDGPVAHRPHPRPGVGGDDHQEHRRQRRHRARHRRAARPHGRPAGSGPDRGGRPEPPRRADPRGQVVGVAPLAGHPVPTDPPPPRPR